MIMLFTLKSTLLTYSALPALSRQTHSVSTSADISFADFEARWALVQITKGERWS